MGEGGGISCLIVGKYPIHKNTLVVVQLFVKVQYSYLIQFLVSG